MSFVSVLQEKRSPSLSEEKQQKKIICGAVALRASANFAGARHKTGGSHTSRPFFVVQMKPGYAGNALPTHAPRLAMSFVSALQEKRSPSLSEEKQQKNIIFGTAALRASANFAGARHKTGGSHTSRPFFVVRMKPGYAGNALPPYAPRLAMSFVSVLQEKKSYPPCSASANARTTSKRSPGSRASACVLSARIPSVSPFFP